MFNQRLIVYIPYDKQLETDAKQNHLQKKKKNRSENNRWKLML